MLGAGQNEPLCCYSYPYIYREVLIQLLTGLLFSYCMVICPLYLLSISLFPSYYILHFTYLLPFPARLKLCPVLILVNSDQCSYVIRPFIPEISGHSKLGGKGTPLTTVPGSTRIMSNITERKKHVAHATNQ
jgi:hypothetical protein